MTKFYIVPVEQEITVNGSDKEDAICNFATSMDMDMNIYFKALSEEEYEKCKKDRTDGAAHDRFDRYETLLINAIEWTINVSEQHTKDIIRAMGITSDELSAIGYDEDNFPAMHVWANE